MKRVMFVCKKNSARSQMAEGFAKTLGSGLVEVTSSGLEASQVNPGAISAMQAVDIDISHQTSKALADFKPEIAAINKGYEGTSIKENLLTHCLCHILPCTQN